MVKHIVLFQLKVELPAETRSKVATDFKVGIEKLPAVIPFIRQIEVGFNINSDETWYICLNATFDTLDDVRAYAVHPSHTAVAGALKPYLSGRSCVDYTV